MNIKIMVATHKKSVMPKDNNLYMPVLVGAKNNYKKGIDYQRDDEGENISHKNPNYSELTAVYWAWKNLTGEDAIGLVHYRRFLKSPGRIMSSKIIEEKDVEKLLSKVPVILPKKRNYFIETNFSHYIHAHMSEPLETTRTVIKNIYPEYLGDFDTVMNDSKAHMFNMFVMRKEYFEEYCDWLFTILDNVEKSVDISNYSTQESRVFGYLSEPLLDVWLRHNNIDYVDVPWLQTGDKKIFKKAFNFLKRKFFPQLKSESHF